ncbi:MAG: FAD-binding oxidoreductase [Deltaproteobacteria bacterium]|nr:MAG: FAD-binding oxidoreductase [Deltaproteobacteria bacterium]
MAPETRPAKVSLSSSLTASFPPGQVRKGREGDAVDGIVPGIVITARDTDDVRRLINEARRDRVAIVPAGGATQLDLGNVPRAADVRLNLTGMTRIVERHPEDMVVTVEAGVTLARLQNVLAADGQRLALDPAAPAQATIGGIVAADASGAMAGAFGRPRDLVLGLTAVDGNARLLRVGAKVVKNVAGYDLVRLLVGSRGSLAILTEITLRTHPIPQCSKTLAFRFPSSEALARAVAALGASELEPAAAEFALEPQSESVWLLRAGIEGVAGAIEYQEHRLAELCQRPAAADDDRSRIHPDRDEKLVLATTVPPARAVSVAADLVGELERAGIAARAAGRPADGLIRVFAREAPGQDGVALLDRLAPLAGGRLLLERAPTRLKHGLDVWGPLPPGFDIMRRLKQRFDPDAVLAPGRMVGRL